MAHLLFVFPLCVNKNQENGKSMVWGFHTTHEVEVIPSNCKQTRIRTSFLFCPTVTLVKTYLYTYCMCRNKSKATKYWTAHFTAGNRDMDESHSKIGSHKFPCLLRPRCHPFCFSVITLCLRFYMLLSPKNTLRW